ncbi:MAG: ABA4-like family protein [Trichodesmium sp. St15_bin1_1]|jgi:hypothetical protein|nr:DUF4281 domain-containing protein [Trichodesmium sp. MAG_R02]MDE5082618.1 ABA4-like family protein [Trichodesmium sp. St18_bin1]MDE5106695.1 ABA4-like family protein [Trichodesmium sp. St17_bin3_1_1]MDE5110094.1 ABA4-like family protein [Trichodesmium sp. St7_bin2_1]MDE5112934.1 ABA4-like family protein [Trichodesmium sp. St15_bin1_1]MDE5116626.1 ABA4-like family protein [Trichodesmium sp. St2_bin2_1]MDE5122382.1 ABA4-like family protein [Trichodesmium sp. St19_bin1]
MTIDLIFNGANLFVLPFWALIIFLPNWKVTRKIMESFIPFILLVAVYLYLLISSLTPESIAALSSSTLSDIAKFFGEESGAATGWVHFLVMDLFVGRWIYWEGQRTGVWTSHSIILCLFAGPLGLLSHILTSWISQNFLSNPKENTTSKSTVEGV